MRVRALSVFVVVGLLAPSAAFASESEAAPVELAPVSEVSNQRVRPPARLSAASGTDATSTTNHAALAGESESAAGTHAVAPTGRWFGCQPPFGGLCVQDREAAKTVAELLPDWSGNTEDWRPLVEAFFDGSDVERAMEVIDCESGGDPNAKNRYSSASGLFQHLGSFWGERSELSGYAGSDIFDPLANVAVAAWLVYDGGGWGHWNASSHCWG